MRLAAALMGMALGAGCSADDGSPRTRRGSGGCLPGEIASCACPDGSFGRQRCTADGVFAACEDCGHAAAPAEVPGAGGSVMVPPSGEGPLDPGAEPSAERPGPAGPDPHPDAGGIDPVADDDPPPARGALAPDLRLTRISVFQGVEVPIMRDGAEVVADARNAPLVVSRPALVRAFFAPDPGFRARELVGRLELHGAAGMEIFEDARSVAAASVDGDLRTTFNFDVPGELVGAGVTYAVSVVEAQAEAGVATGAARWPGEGVLPLSPSSTNGPFRLHIVPVVQNGITPDVSPARIQHYRDHFFGLFPVPDVELTVGGPVTPSITVSAGGGGWAQLLNFIEQLRLSESADGRTYYFGAVAPARSFRSYCGLGCVAGLAAVPPDGSTVGRSAVGLGYFPDGSGSAFVASHEIGHSLGRPHAPCGTGDAAPGFPHSGGGIGVWGFDLVQGELRDPSTYKDLMGYCDPRWISDFNYRAVFGRVARVNAARLVLEPSVEDAAVEPYRVVIVGEAGELSWGYPLDVPRGPLGPEIDVRMLDAAGRTIGSIAGFWMPFEDLEGGFLLIPERGLGPGVRALNPVGLGRGRPLLVQ